MNSKKDKQELIKAIINKEIDRKDLSSRPVIVSNGSEAFFGLMISVSQRKAGKTDPVIFVGKAKELIDETLNNVKSKRNGKTE